MPMSFPDGPLSRLLDSFEAKSLVRAFKKAGRAGGRVGGGIVIDTRGRRWNSALHPRDSRGRFIETGGIAQVWGGGRGRVVRALGNGKVELRMADGKRNVQPASRLTMVSRPNGGRPVKDDGTRKSRALVMAEDVARDAHPKRGDGQTADDDHDGIPNHMDHTPDGFIDGPEPDWKDDGKDDDLADGPKYAGKRPTSRPQIVRDEFSSVKEVTDHWKTLDDGGEAGSRADRLESAQLSPEGEHLVARVDGKWQVFQSDTGKVVAGHNGSRTLVDKKAALEKASQLDDVYDPDPVKRAPAAKGPKLPRGHRDAGNGYTIKDVKPKGDDLKQVELYDGKGELVASTTSRMDTRAPQAFGWRGEAHGLDVKAHNEDEFVAKAKQIDQAAKAERDPQVIERMADRFWQETVQRNGGDEKKAARAVRAHVSQKRARGKGSTTTPMGRRDEKINKALEARAAAAEKGQPVPTAAARKADAPAAPAPVQAAPDAPAAPPVDTRPAPNAPDAVPPRTAAANVDGPQTITAKIDDLTAKVDALTEQIGAPDDREKSDPVRSRLDELDAEHADDPAIKKHVDAARQAHDEGDGDKAEHHMGVANALSNARKKKAEKDAERDAQNRDRADASESNSAGDSAGREPEKAKTEDDGKDTAADKPRAEEKPTPEPRDNGSNPTKNGVRDDSAAVREDRGELLADVPAEPSREDEGPDGVLPGSRRAGDGADQVGSGRRPAGGESDGAVDVPRREGGARAGQEGSRGDGAARPGVPAAGARDGDAPRAADADAGVGGRGGQRGGQRGTRKPAGGTDRVGGQRKPAGKPRRFKPKGQEDLARKGERNKVQDNLAALRLLRKLNEEDRQATPQEQAVLARWAGWGALPDVFDDGKASSYVTDAERAELKELLSPDEYREARANTKNAHYTDASVVMAMWAAMKDLGFSDGDVLEPGSGSGNFMGFAPDGARMTGVELDPITAAISRQLYPDAEIHNESFGDSPFRQGSFDAVIGNVPFGNFPVYDKTYNKGNQHSIHDHFIIKALASTKPGGIATIVTSSFTMDKQSPESRKAIAKYGDLLGAVRLPSGAHKDAAGTDVVTDVLIFRRRKDSDAPADMSWLNASPAVHANGEPVLGVKPKNGDAKQQYINDYFRDNPDKVLGSLKNGGFNSIAVQPDGDTQPKLQAALRDITKKADAADRGFNVDADAPKIAKRNVGSDRDGRIAYVGEDELGTGRTKKDRGHKFEVMEDGKRVPLDVPKTQQEELRDLLAIRDAADELIDAENKYDDSNPTVSAARKRLNRLYDEYVAKKGPITRFDLNERTDAETGETKVTRKSPPVMRYALDDEGAASLFGLEHGYDPGTKTAKKADIFHTRQIARDRAIPDKADTPEDALALAAERGDAIDSTSIGKLLGMPPEHVEDLLVGNGLAFRDHEGSGQLIPADQYKSGNIRQKLAAARAAAENDPRLNKNVEALEEVMPADAELDVVPKQLGAPWMGTDVVREFARSLMGTDVDVTYSPEEGWKAPTPSRGRVAAREAEWGTPDRSFYQLLESALKQQHKVITVTRTNEDGSKWVDKKASELATAAAANIEAAWEDFIWSNADVGNRITARYNEKFRSIVPRVADTRPRSYPGMAVGKDLRPHQNGGVNRIVSDESVLLEHVVGSGKTYTLAAGAMELRRLGLANKVALTVPNPLLAQWVSEFKDLYPNAKILTVDSDAIGKGAAARKRFAAKVRNNDWDVVLFTGESFEAIPVSEGAFRNYMAQEVDLLQRRLAKAKANGKKVTIKSIEKQISALEAKIEEAVKKRYDEDGITFEDLGIDYVMVDEAHRYKNLPFSTGIQGVNPPNGADRARDMHMKLGLLRDLSEERGGPKRVATFATGTPISNSLAEMYTMERFLRPDLLEEAGVDDFDSWAATFASIVKKTESDNSSTGYVERVRFRGFTDAIGDGLRLWRSFADTVTGKQLEEAGYITVPKLHGGARKIHVVERTPEQTRARASFKSRIEAMVGRGRAKKGDDTHVAVINDGRAMAIDPRLMSERGRAAAGIDRDDPNLDSPKLDSAASTIVDIWKREKNREFKVNHDDPDDAPKAARKGALQMAFIDSSAPKRDQFNAYTALKDRLVAQGMDPKRIRFVQETAGNPEAKARLMEEARQGGVDLIIGSTEALGTGTNAQNRLVALHHIEASWKPSDIEQREGRALRQGNQYGEVEVHAYITKGTHDEKTWDMIAYKQAGLDELQNGDYNTRAVEFADDVDPLKDFDTLAGEAAEDALAIDMRELQSDLKGLEAAKRQYDRSQSRARSIIDDGRRAVAGQDYAIQRLDAALKDRVDVSGDKFKMSVQSGSGWRSTFSEVDTRDGAADRLKEKLTPFLEGYVPVGENNQGTIAELGGFKVRATTINQSGRKPHISLEFMPTDARGDYAQALPLEPVIVSREDLAGNMRGVVQRLENRLGGMEARRDHFKKWREQNLVEIGAATEQIGKPFRQADELDSARERMRLVSTLLTPESAKNDQGEALPKEALDDMRKTYDRLKEQAAAKSGSGKRRKPAAGVVADSSAPSAPPKMAESAPRPKADAPSKPKGERKPSAPRVPKRDGEQEQITLDPEQVQADADALARPDVPGPVVPDPNNADRVDGTPDVTPDSTPEVSSDVTPDAATDVTPDVAPSTGGGRSGGRSGSSGGSGGRGNRPPASGASDSSTPDPADEPTITAKTAKDLTKGDVFIDDDGNERIVTGVDNEDGVVSVRHTDTAGGNPAEDVFNDDEPIRLKGADEAATAEVQPAPPKPEDLTVVDSVNEGQLDGQTRIGGEAVRSEIGEDFLQQQDMTPKAPKEPVDEPAKQDGPSLFDAPDAAAPDAPEAPAAPKANDRPYHPDNRPADMESVATPVADVQEGDILPGKGKVVGKGTTSRGQIFLVLDNGEGSTGPRSFKPDATVDVWKPKGAADQPATPNVDTTPDADVTPKAPEAPDAPKAKTPRKSQSKAPELEPTPEDPFGIERHVGEWKPDAVAASKFGALGPLWSKLGKDTPEAQAVWVASNMTFGGDPKDQGAAHFKRHGDVPEVVDAVERLSEHMRGTHGDSDLANRLDKWLDGYREASGKSDATPEAPEAPAGRPKTAADYQAEMDAEKAAEKAKWNRPDPATTKAGDLKPGDVIDLTGGAPGGWLVQKIEDNGDGRLLISAHPADWPGAKIDGKTNRQFILHPDDLADGSARRAGKVDAPETGAATPSEPVQAPAADAPEAPSAPTAPTAPKGSKRPLKRDEVTFHEQYGNVSRGQLAAYKKHNVPPATHDELVRFYGEDAHERIRKAVIDPDNHMDGSTSFSEWKWRDGLADEDRLYEATKPDTAPDVTPAGAGDGRDGGDTTPPAPATPDEPDDTTPSEPVQAPSAAGVDPYHPSSKPDNMDVVTMAPGQLQVGDIMPGAGKVVEVAARPFGRAIGQDSRTGITVEDKDGNRKYRALMNDVPVKVWKERGFEVPNDPKGAWLKARLAAKAKAEKARPVRESGRAELLAIHDAGILADHESPEYRRAKIADEIRNMATSGDGGPEFSKWYEDASGQEMRDLVNRMERDYGGDLKREPMREWLREDHARGNEPAPTSDDLPDPTDERVPDPVEVGEPTPADVPAPKAPMSEKEKYVRGRIAGEKHAPTEQQADIYTAAAVDGKDVIVEAKAGTGKTSTLEGLARRIAELDPKARILYAAFNKSVQLEAEGRMPANVETRTGHSLAWNFVGRKITDKFGKSGQLSNVKDVARHLGITDDLGDYEPEDLARAVQKALGQYVLSADDKVSAKHFQGIDLKPDEMKKLVGYAEKAWEDYKDPNGRLRVSQDDFRKMWALARPDLSKAGAGNRRAATILFVDEAQDTPPVLAKVFADQKMQKIIVGDSDQAIYGFAGATDYLSKAQGDVRLPLHKSWRYGPAIADAGNRFLQLLGSKDRAIGGGAKGEIVEDMQDATGVITRTNGGLLSAIEEELGRGRTVSVPKGTKTELLSLIESAGYLRGERGKPWKGMHPDLEPFNTWAEVKKAADKGDDPKIAMVARLVDRYGIDGMEDLVSRVTEPADDVLSGVQIDRDDHRLSLGGNTWALNEAVKKANDGAGLSSLGFRFRKNESGKGGTWEFAGSRDAQERPLAEVRRLLGAGEEEKPDVTVSTAHKAKGLEWERVRIGDDFPQPKVDEDSGAVIFPNDEEKRLAYVALTRAIGALDPGSLGYVYEYTDENGGAPGSKPTRKEDAPSAPDNAPGTAPVTAPETAPNSAPNAPESAPAATAPSAPDAPARKPVKDLTDDELWAELDEPDLAGRDEQRYIDLITEADDREQAAANNGGFGGDNGLGQRQSAPAPVRVGDVRGEVHELNQQIVDRGWDGSVSGGQAPSDGLDRLPKRYRQTILDGGKVPAVVIAKYVPEETTLHLWGMTPDEMRQHGMTHYGIPNGVSLHDRMKERVGGDFNDPNGVLERDVADLHDDELDEAVDLVKKTGDAEHLEWLGMEQARRAQLSEEDRKREDEDRRDRRDAENEGDDGYDDESAAKPDESNRDGQDDNAEHPVGDKTDQELHKHINENPDDKDARNERDRRNRLNDDERKKDDEERRRRRRNRRRNRRNRRNRRGPHPRLPHLRMPDPNTNPNQRDGHSNGDRRPGDSGTPQVPGDVRPNVDGNTNAVEDALKHADEQDPIREDGTLTPASGKDGVDMTEEERAAENAAADAAYGDPKPGMEADAVADAGVKPDYLPQQQWDDLQSHAAPLREAGLPIEGWRSGNEYGRPWAAFDVRDVVTGDSLGVAVSTNDRGDGFKIDGTLWPTNGGASTVKGKELAKVLDRFAKSPAERERLGMGPIAAKGDLIPAGTTGTPAVVGEPLPENRLRGDFVAADRFVRARDLQPGTFVRHEGGIGEVLSVEDVPYPGRGPKQTLVHMRPAEGSDGPAVIRTTPGQNFGVFDAVAPVGSASKPEAPAAATPDVTPDVAPDGPRELPKPEDLIVTPEAPASAPNTPTPAESAPSAPGAAPSAGAPQAPAAPPAAPATPSAPSARPAATPGRMPNGLTPAQVADVLRPGQDGLPAPVVFVMEDGQVHMGRPVGNPDGTLRGIDVGGVEIPVDASQVRQMRPLNVAQAAPEASDVAPSSAGGSVPGDGTPIPDGLSTPREPEPDAFDGGDRPQGDVPADRPWVSEPGSAAGRPDHAPERPAGGDRTGSGTDSPETVVDEDAGTGSPVEAKPSKRERPSWARRAREAARRRAERRRSQQDPEVADGRQDTPEAPAAGDTPEPAAEPQDAGAQIAAYVSPVTLQIGDYARVEGYDVNGAKTSTAGFLMDDPQPVVADLGDGEVDMLAVTVSDEYDGLGITRTVYVPLDSMSSLSPRPNMDEVPDEGWMLDENRLKVRDNRMPDRIPTARNGLGLYPGSLVSDRRRQGRVVQARAQDVTVMWDDNEKPETRTGATLDVADQGAARPDGWSFDGRRVVRLGKPGSGRSGATRHRGRTSDGRRVGDREAMSEAEALAADLFDRIERATRQIQRGNLSRRQKEELIRKLARDALNESTRRRADAARRIAAAYPHRPGLLAQIVAWLHRMATAVVEALVAFFVGLGQGLAAGYRDGSVGIASNARRREFVEHARSTAGRSSAKRSLDGLLDKQDAAA